MVTNPQKGFTFDAPTANVDGSPVATGEIAKYQLGVGLTTGNYTTILDDVDLTPDSAGKQIIPTSAIKSLAFGAYFAAVRAVTSAGNQSAWSTETQFALVAPTPNPPTGLSVA